MTYSKPPSILGLILYLCYNQPHCPSGLGITKRASLLQELISHLTSSAYLCYGRRAAQTRAKTGDDSNYGSKALCCPSLFLFDASASTDERCLPTPLRQFLLQRASVTISKYLQRLSLKVPSIHPSTVVVSEGLEALEALAQDLPHAAHRPQETISH